MTDDRHTHKLIKVALFVKMNKTHFLISIEVFYLRRNTQKTRLWHYSQGESSSTFAKKRIGSKASIDKWKRFKQSQTSYLKNHTCVNTAISYCYDNLVWDNAIMYNGDAQLTIFPAMSWS